MSCWLRALPPQFQTLLDDDDVDDDDAKVKKVVVLTRESCDFAQCQTNSLSISHFCDFALCCVWLEMGLHVFYDYWW